MHRNKIDFDLMRKIQNGDNIAFGKMVERYRNGLMVTINKILRNKHDSEDVLQETFLSVYKNKLCGDIT